MDIGHFVAGFEDPEASNPGIDIDGMGEMYLPFDPKQGGQLSKLCCEAPFGRGEDTVYDPAVRQTRQLEPSKISFTNPGLLILLAVIGTPVTCEAASAHAMQLLFVPTCCLNMRNAVRYQRCYTAYSCNASHCRVAWLCQQCG